MIGYKKDAKLQRFRNEKINRKYADQIQKLNKIEIWRYTNTYSVYIDTQTRDRQIEV